MENLEIIEEQLNNTEIAILSLLDKYLKNDSEQEINILLSKLEETENNKK